MKQMLAKLITQSLETLKHHGELSIDNGPSVEVDYSKDAQHGDYSSNIALLLAKPLGRSPRDIAQQLVPLISEHPSVSKVDIAGPGFINFFIKPTAWHTLIKHILDAKECFGQLEDGKGQRIYLEMVSANPTGPLHVGHGRHAAYGSSLANILRTVGYEVHQEYYVNDAGRQMHILTVSIWLRYLESAGQTVPFPSGGYQGDYITDLARSLYTSEQDRYLIQDDTLFTHLIEDTPNTKDAYVDQLIEKAKHALGAERYKPLFEYGLNAILADIKEDLTEFGVTFQQWFHESYLHDSKEIEAGIKQLQKNDYVYEHEGALWFKATHFGDEKDRVIRRNNGQYTYFAADIGYHLHKYQQGFDFIIDVLGADHHGYVSRINGFLKALSQDTDKLHCLLVQFVSLYRKGTKISMSTREGSFVTLRELRNEVGNDAARFFFVMRRHEQPLDFDLALATSQSNDNPVYYIQYAHARITSVLKQLSTQKFEWSDAVAKQTTLDPLQTPHEIELMRYLARYHETLRYCARYFEPQALANYLQELANRFHTYYNAYPFIVEDTSIRNARVALITATRTVLAQGLQLLGVSAPSTM